jgi:hypothetical protein
LPMFRFCQAGQLRSNYFCHFYRFARSIFLRSCRKMLFQVEYQN